MSVASPGTERQDRWRKRGHGIRRGGHDHTRKFDPPPSPIDTRSANATESPTGYDIDQNSPSDGCGISQWSLILIVATGLIHLTE